jgi:hypothetical protein
MLKQKKTWLSLFIGLFIGFLSYIYWPISEDKTYLGLPAWAYFMASLHIGFLIVLFFFSKHFWTEK